MSAQAILVKVKRHQRHPLYKLLSRILDPGVGRSKYAHTRDVLESLGCMRVLCSEETKKNQDEYKLPVSPKQSGQTQHG